MSNDVNTAIQERIGEEVAELTTNELLKELQLPAATRPVADWRRVQLEEALSIQRWEEYPDGPM